ncbi:MAG TPA: hypothetical protein VE734_02670 [Terriglobales bacterium]|jgi:hypothetical protein|nr:hypothetical protein [Terriglobales bacterium]
MGEKFNIAELANLRNELVRGGLDLQQAGELLQLFLMGHGYGVSRDAARDAAGRVGCAGLSLEVIQQELEHLALAM